MAEVAELAKLIKELQQVVSAQQAEIQSLRQQQGQQQPPPRQQADTRLGQPPVFIGEESAFKTHSKRLTL